MPRLAAALSVAALIASGLSVCEASASPVRGVAPEDQAAFGSLEAFECVVDGKRAALPRERLNDDYCDCDDGSDEPGTAACSHVSTSAFHCSNDGYFPRKVRGKRGSGGFDAADPDGSIGLVPCVRSTPRP